MGITQFKMKLTVYYQDFMYVEEISQELDWYI